MGHRLLVADIGRNLARIYEYAPPVKGKQTPLKTFSATYQFEMSPRVYLS